MGAKTPVEHIGRRRHLYIVHTYINLSIEGVTKFVHIYVIYIELQKHLLVLYCSNYIQVDNMIELGA